MFTAAHDTPRGQRSCNCDADLLVRWEEDRYGMNHRWQGHRACHGPLTASARAKKALSSLLQLRRSGFTAYGRPQYIRFVVFVEDLLILECIVSDLFVRRKTITLVMLQLGFDRYGQSAENFRRRGALYWISSVCCTRQGRRFRGAGSELSLQGFPATWVGILKSEPQELLLCSGTAQSSLKGGLRDFFRDIGVRYGLREKTRS